MHAIRLGYVGCGFMAQKVHIPNFLSIPGCELVALAEVRQDLGRRVQARYHIPRLYPHHEALLLAPDVDAIAVSGGFMEQGEIAREALLAGKDVFMEKPMAISLAQADRILDAAKSSGRRLMVGYMKRYDVGNELARAKIKEFRASGELGAVILARSHEFGGEWIAGLDTPLETTDEPMPQMPVHGPDWLPPEFLRSYLGYLQEYCHQVNLLRWFLEAGENVAVRAVDLSSDGYTGVAILNVAGTRAVVESGASTHYRWDEQIQIYFEHGWVRTQSPPLLLKHAPVEVEIERFRTDPGCWKPVPYPAYSWSYRREAEHFIHCLQTGEPFRSPGEDARTDVRILEEIYRVYLTQRGLL